MRQSDYFISYTKVDERWALWIAWLLNQEGYSFTIQALDFAPGRDFMHEMRRAMRACRQTIAVLSPEYLKSQYATAEVNAVLASDPIGSKGRLIPVRVKKFAMKDLLASRIYIDLTNKNDETARHDFLAGIAAARLQRPPTSDLRFDKPPRFPGADESQDSPAPRRTRTAEHVVAVLYLGVETGAGLDLAGQANEIRQAIDNSANSARFKFTSRLDVNSGNIFDVVNSCKPHIVHFSGKQNGGNVVIRTATGQTTTISDLALAGLLQNVHDTVALAIVDTCKSLRCARSVVGTVDFAMGVEGDIYDNDATLFYRVFYEAITAGRSVFAATAQARAALNFNKTKTTEIPQLIVRNGADPRKYKFI